MDWITLIMPIAREVRAIVDLFQRDNSRAPSDAELEAILRTRVEADTNWKAALERARDRG